MSKQLAITVVLKNGVELPFPTAAKIVRHPADSDRVVTPVLDRGNGNFETLAMFSLENVAGWYWTETIAEQGPTLESEPKEAEVYLIASRHIVVVGSVNGYYIKNDEVILTRGRSGELLAGEFFMREVGYWRSKDQAKPLPPRHIGYPGT